VCTEGENPSAQEFVFAGCRAVSEGGLEEEDEAAVEDERLI